MSNEVTSKTGIRIISTHTLIVRLSELLIFEPKIPIKLIDSSNNEIIVTNEILVTNGISTVLVTYIIIMTNCS